MGFLLISKLELVSYRQNGKLLLNLLIILCLSFTAHCLGLLAASATLISEDFHMTEVFAVLTEAIRDNFRNTQLKQHLVPALGEFLFYASTQEDTEGRQIVKWDVPGKDIIILVHRSFCCNQMNQWQFCPHIAIS